MIATVRPITGPNASGMKFVVKMKVCASDLALKESAQKVSSAKLTATVIRSRANPNATRDRFAKTNDASMRALSGEIVMMDNAVRMASACKTTAVPVVVQVQAVVLARAVVQVQAVMPVVSEPQAVAAAKAVA